MKLSGTKIFCAVFIAFLIVAPGSTTQTQKQPDCKPDPPWFNPAGNCSLKQRTLVGTNSVGWPNRNNRDCYFRVDVCSLHLSRKTILPLGTTCPEAKDFTQPTFCCDELDKAVKSKQPCDPMQDADCDGLPNDTDPDPLAPPDPDGDNKCGTLASDVDDAYRKAGANVKTGMAAAENAREDCYRRKHDKKCGIPTPDTPNDPAIYFPDPDSDDKCKQLESDVYEAYKKAGANLHTAWGAAETAKYDCLKKRASKM